LVCPFGCGSKPAGASDASGQSIAAAGCSDCSNNTTMLPRASGIERVFKAWSSVAFRSGWGPTSLLIYILPSVRAPRPGSGAAAVACAGSCCGGSSQCRAHWEATAFGPPTRQFFVAANLCCARARPRLVSSQSFSDPLSTSSANRSQRATTSPRCRLSLGVVASAWSIRARAAAAR
jgi:hypothetical protein